MNSTTAEIAVKDYLRRLDRALVALPALRRKQLVADIAGHIATSRAELADPNEADVRNMLDRIGRPEDIATEALEDDPSLVLAQNGRTYEGLAIVLLLCGGFLFGVGWLVGVALLWTSRAWRIRDKLLGTVLLPGGLLFPLLLALGPGRTAFGSSCVKSIPAGGTPGAYCAGTIAASWVGIALLVAAFLIPILTALHLRRAALRTRRA